MGHDSYEFMGQLYPHRFTDWLRGEPWYFYFVLIKTKMPILTLLSFGMGLVLLFRQKSGDGRYFLLLWFALWSLAFMAPGGKFTRYITSVLPAIFITAAIGVQFMARWLGRFCARVFENESIKVYARSALASLVIISAFWSAVVAAPHYRLYMSVLGGGPAQAGAYFPQDEFYDAYMQDVMAELAKRAHPNARVASEIPSVAAYYAQRSNELRRFVQSRGPRKIDVWRFRDRRARTHLLHQSGNVDAVTSGQSACIYNFSGRYQGREHLPVGPGIAGRLARREVVSEAVAPARALFSSSPPLRSGFCHALIAYHVITRATAQ